MSSINMSITTEKMDAALARVKMRMIGELQNYINNPAYIPVKTGKLRDTTQLLVTKKKIRAKHTVDYAKYVVKKAKNTAFLKGRYIQILTEELSRC